MIAFVKIVVLLWFFCIQNQISLLVRSIFLLVFPFFQAIQLEFFLRSEKLILMKILLAELFARLFSDKIITRKGLYIIGIDCIVADSWIREGENDKKVLLIEEPLLKMTHKNVTLMNLILQTALAWNPIKNKTISFNDKNSTPANLNITMKFTPISIRSSIRK